MKVSVQFFAAAKDAAGTDRTDVSLTGEITVQNLRDELCRCFPKLQPYYSTLLFAVDNQYAQNETVIQADQDVACFPPVSGG